MKTKVIISFVVLAILSAIVEAHPPKKNEITFDREQMKIQVKAFHSVGNPASHFVKRIIVELNGAEIAEREFTGQTNAEFQETEFALPPSVGIRGGDEIAVTAYCNKFGKKKSVLQAD